MLTVLAEDAQVPLDIVQVRTVVPTGKPVTEVVGLFGLLKVTPAPVQTPVPIVGALPAKIVLSAHKV